MLYIFLERKLSFLTENKVNIFIISNLYRYQLEIDKNFISNATNSVKYSKSLWTFNFRWTKILYVKYKECFGKKMKSLQFWLLMNWKIIFFSPLNAITIISLIFLNVMNGFENKDKVVFRTTSSQIMLCIGNCGQS